MILAGNDHEAAQKFASTLLRPLLKHDSEGGSLIETLRVFLACSAQTRAAAQRLAVHENTVRYRLAKIAEISSIDPYRLESLLDATFALRLLDLDSKSQQHRS